MKQMSGGTCPVTVVLSKQATHAPRLTLKTQAPCRAKVLPNAVSFQMESKSGPCRPDVHGLAMTQTSPTEFQSDRRHTETDSTLRLPFEILPLGELAKLKSGHTAATGSDHVVLWPL